MKTLLSLKDRFLSALMMISTFIMTIVTFLLLKPLSVIAHEVYVLTPFEIKAGIEAARPDYLYVIRADLQTFIIAGLTSIAIVLSILWVSTRANLETLVDPFLISLKRYAPIITQFTLGIAMIASGYYAALFGIEIPFSQVFGSYIEFFRALSIIVGALLVTGIFPRLAAMIVLISFIPLFAIYNVYLIHYLTYLGEALTVILFGASYSILPPQARKSLPIVETINLKFHKYKFLILRVCFGLSLVYASYFAKFLHGSLALMTVEKYNLTQYFPFDPLFVVVGAMIIEIVIGVFIVAGFEIRFMSLFYLGFLVLSVLFFKEAVWPHIVLFGTAVAMFVHGYDPYTITGKYFEKNHLEPIL